MSRRVGTCRVTSAGVCWLSFTRSFYRTSAYACQSSWCRRGRGATAGPARQPRATLTLVLALVGEQLDVVGMLLEHATQKGTFLVPGLAIAHVRAARLLVMGSLALEHLTRERELTLERYHARRICVRRHCIRLHVGS